MALFLCLFSNNFGSRDEGKWVRVGANGGEREKINIVINRYIDVHAVKMQ